MNIPKGYVRIPIQGVGIGFRHQIKNDLTIVADSTSSFQKEQTVHRMFFETPTHIGVPRGYYLSMLKHRGVDGEVDISNGQTFTKCEREWTFREGQAEIVEKAVEICTKYSYGGCIVEAGVGSGKTKMSLEIARRLGHKTLIIVPTTVLMSQWKEEIALSYPNWRVGYLQGNKIEVRGYDVCVAIINSVAMKDDYPDWLYDEFGTIIVDEVHRAASEEFAKAVPRFAARYVIGVSGTVKRADRCENVFIHTIGQILPFMNKVKTMTPQIYFIDTGFAWTGWRAALDRQRVKFLTKLVQDPSRNTMIVRQAVKAAKSGRNVLILTERVGHVKELRDKIKIELVGTELTVGEMVGTTPEAERKKSQVANIIVATVQLVGTGFNEPRLDTLIFASPIQNVTQAIGRITRLHPNKKMPFVLDLVDTHSDIGMTFGRSRFKKYLALGYRITGYQCLGRDFLWKYKKELGL